MTLQEHMWFLLSAQGDRVGKPKLGSLVFTTAKWLARRKPPAGYSQTISSLQWSRRNSLALKQTCLQKHTAEPSRKLVVQPHMSLNLWVKSRLAPSSGSAPGHKLPQHSWYPFPGPKDRLVKYWQL
eukprot:s2924_g2.t1